jgi:hypothetical protein
MSKLEITETTEMKTPQVTKPPLLEYFKNVITMTAIILAAATFLFTYSLSKDMSEIAKKQAIAAEQQAGVAEKQAALALQQATFIKKAAIDSKLVSINKLNTEIELNAKNLSCAKGVQRETDRITGRDNCGMQYWELGKLMSREIASIEISESLKVRSAMVSKVLPSAQFFLPLLLNCTPRKFGFREVSGAFRTPEQFQLQ